MNPIAELKELTPQLADKLSLNHIGQYILNESYCLQQKLNGKRVFMWIVNGEVIPMARPQRGNKFGIRTDCPSVITDSFNLLASQSDLGTWLFDGELVEDTYWVFDVLKMPLYSTLHTEQLWERLIALELLFKVWTYRSPRIQMVKTAFGPEGKRDLFERVAKINGEGVMIKDLRRPYRFGQRNTSMLKVKFVETCEVFVTKVGRVDPKDGHIKNSLGIGMIHNGEAIKVGAVTVAPWVLAKAKENDVIEVAYLNMSRDLQLYQPAWVKFRPDVPWTDCTTDQCKLVNLEVVADDNNDTG